MLTPLPLRARVPGAARARVDVVGDRPAIVVDVDASVRRGALTASASETIAQAARTARHERLPLVGFLNSSGADLNEGIAALDGWGRAARQIAACSGVVPVVFGVSGPAVSGPALLLGLADHVVMSAGAYAFVSGPNMVAEYTGVVVSNAELGGAGTHARATGVASLVVPDEEAIRPAVGDLLAYLPDSVDEEPPCRPTDDPVGRRTPEAGAAIPASSTGSYDVRMVMRAVVDGGELLEVREGWASNLVTAFASIGGRPVGILGNQPLAIAGTLDIPASQKGARFVAFCDAFNLPLVTLVDTPGFYPGKDLEWRGMIRHGAQLVFAYGRATVPRVCVILRKSYGGAYIVMDSKRMGNDVCLAWPGAELAVMGAKGAVEILHRRATPEERLATEREYEERLLNPYVAAERGYVDAVIDPADTRAEVAAALETLAAKRERLVPRKHDNSPL
jgi:acetyl-CoA carboxylase carboxyltransferase component